MEVEGASPSSQCCPSCGSELWSDPGQVKQLIRLQSVIATVQDKETRLDDRQDERTKKSFLRKMHVTFKKENVDKGYKIPLEKGTFAFEFISSASFCEVNYGERGLDRSPIEIAGEKKPAKGFLVCTKCGKVQNGKEPKHTYSCPNKVKKAEATQFTDSVWLYRQFESECIRLLIPPDYGPDFEKGTSSFIAAFHLGLKKMFGGSIDHLQVTHHQEPIRNGHCADYLVLYDTVPGGTGYLKQLTSSPDAMIQVLTHAFNTLRTCKCTSDSSKDGCYRCLYSYRFSRDMRAVSRELAKKMLAEIIKNKDSIEDICRISSMDIESEIELSELERLFLKTIANHKDEKRKTLIKSKPVNGKPGLEFIFEENMWQLESNVYDEIPGSQGKKIQIDFVIKPIKINGCSLKAQNCRRIAVFTDGLSVHKHQIYEDMWKRMLLVQNGQYYTWSITWHDLFNFRKSSQVQEENNFLSPSKAPNGTHYQHFIYEKNLRSFQNFLNENSYSLLLEFMHNPNFPTNPRWEAFAEVLAWLFLQPQKQIEKFNLESVQSIPRPFKAHIDNSSAIGCSEKGIIRSFFSLSSDKKRYSITCCLDDSDLEKSYLSLGPTWKEYLRLHNLFQFLPQAYFITKRGIDIGYYSHEASIEDSLTDSENPLSPTWQETFDDCYDENAKKIIAHLASKDNAELPIVGYEYLAKDKVIGTAELAWPEQRVAYITEDQSDALQAFQKHGWTCITSQEIQNNLDDALSTTLNNEIKS
jgi:DEAD/DEAH box helicase domain-containing protein